MTPFLLLSRVSQTFSEKLAPWRTPLQFIAGALALTLGYWGWSLREPTSSWTGDLNNFFRTLQLITLQFPPVLTGEIPWQLQVARLLLPLVAVAASIQIFIGAATRPFRLALLPRLRDHVIVVGVGQMTDSALLSLVERGQRVVLAAPLITPIRRGELEGAGLTVIDWESGDDTALRALNVKQAKALLVVGPNDLDNLNVAAVGLLANEGRDRGAPDLVMAVILSREDIASQTEAALDGVARAHHVSFQRLCPDREGSRLELARVAPVFTRKDRDTAAHVLVLGLVGNWEQVVAQLISATQDHATKTPILSFVLRAAEREAFEAWRAARPGLPLVVRVEVLDAKDGLPDDSDASALVSRCGRPHLVVVLRDDIDAVAVALALRQPGNAFHVAHVPILVRQSREDRLLKALGGAKPGARDLTNIVAFGGVVRPESMDRVLDRKGDEFAMALHAFYLDHTKIARAGSEASRRAWEELPENLREANRASAAHVPILFASRGLRIVAAEDPASSFSLAAPDLDWLSRVEHKRWLADRIDRGWRYGPTRDDPQRFHPSLVAFENLPEAERDKDRAAVRAMLKILEGLGQRLTRDGATAEPSKIG